MFTPVCVSLESARKGFVTNSREVRIASTCCPKGAQLLLAAGSTSELPAALLDHAFKCPICTQVMIYFLQMGNAVEGHA